MKKYFSIFVAVLAVTFTFYMCDSQSDVNPESTVEQVNKFDYLGEIHNKGLNEGLREFYNETVKKGVNPSTIDVKKFTNDFTVSFMEKEILKREKVTDVQKLRKNLQALAFPKTTTLRSTSAEVEESTLTDFQKSYFDAVLQLFENENIDVEARFIEIEKEVLNTNVPAEEKDPVLGLLAISKYSLAFWTERVIEVPEAEKNPIYSRSISKVSSLSTNSLVEIEGEIFIQMTSDDLKLKDIRDAAMKFVGNDAIGFAGGVLAGLLNPASATGLVFGPGGYVLTIAGEATYSAIASSIIGVFIP